MKSFLTIFTVLLLFKANAQTIVVRVHPSLVDLTITEVGAPVEIQLQGVFNEDGRSVFLEFLSKNPDFSDLGEFTVRRIFTNFSWRDSLSVSRTGEIISVPPFWATFAIDDLKSSFSLKLLGALQSANEWVDYAEYAGEVIMQSAPDDEFYPQQYSLIYNPTIPNANIQVEDAWEIETGKPFVKIGVVDTGIDTIHEDIDVLFGGAYNRQTNTGEWGSGIDLHGTAVASIIGAKRDNGIGIAGIAGGDTSDASGISLIDLKWDAYLNQADLILAATVDGSRGVGTYWNYGVINNSDGDPIPYFENAPGFGVNILNQSNMIRAVIPTAVSEGKDLPIDSIIVDFGECKLCRETFLFSFKSGVINVVSRGNANLVQPDPTSGLVDSTAEYGFYPQSFSDDWIISVGASGYDGTTVRRNINQGYWDSIGGFAPLYGGNMDLIAPGSDSIVKAAIYINGTSSYRWFNGTSGAAPHVSGVVGLLLSYYNRPYCYSNQNLTVEDVEYILENSATDVMDPGYDIRSAHGRLNAYEALKMIEYPIKQFVHPTTIIDTTLLERDTIAIHYKYAFTDAGWGPISRNFLPRNDLYYQVERLKYQATYDFSSYLTPSTTINAILPLLSKSNALRFIEDTVNNAAPGWVYDYLDVHPYVDMVDIDTLNGLLTTEGYYYHFIATYLGVDNFILDENFPIDYWYPANPMVEGVKLPVSIYLTDSSLTALHEGALPCDSLNPPYDVNLGIKPTSERLLKVFPNPSTDHFTVEFPDTGYKHLRVVDLSGKELFAATTNEKKFLLNLNHFAAGTFIVHVTTDKGMYVTKLVKL